MSLPLRELGRTGVKIPAVGLGCMVRVYRILYNATFDHATQLMI